MPHHAQPRRDFHAHYLQAAGLIYAVAGLAALWLLSPRVPYADQWRHYARLLRESVATGVLTADNGHPEVLPNLIRLADLRWCGGHEVLQLICAGVCAIAGLLLLLDIVRRDVALDVRTRAGMTFCLAFGWFWLGNEHALTVPCDCVHVYLVLLCLALALRLALVDSAQRPMRLVFAAALCGVATFTFGSGIATFAALAAAVFAFRRDVVPRIGVLGAIALATLLLYLTLPNAVHESEGGELHPIQAIVRLLQVLGAPFMYLFWPLLDPSVALAVPAPFRGIALTCANFWLEHVGDIRTSVFPQAAFGALMLIATSVATWRARAAGGAARLGVALAWFGIACAALIVLARAAYFDLYPGQIYALRYLPWSDVAWSGLLLTILARPPKMRFVYALVLCLPLVALPSEVGLFRLAQRTRDVAEAGALGAVVGVLPPDLSLGETQLDDVRAALPLLRSAKTAMFAWPAGAELQQPLPADARALSAAAIGAEAVSNLLGADATRLHTRLATPACGTPVLVAVGGVVVGLLRRTDDDMWSGFALAGPASDFHLYTLCR